MRAESDLLRIGLSVTVIKECVARRSDHQGGPQMSENVEKVIAINFPHLKHPKAPQKYRF